jgi:hypothetical protein
MAKDALQAALQPIFRTIWARMKELGGPRPSNRDVGAICLGALQVVINAQTTRITPDIIQGWAAQAQERHDAMAGMMAVAATTLPEVLKGFMALLERYNVDAITHAIAAGLGLRSAIEENVEHSMQEFLAEQPHWLTCDVKYRRLDGTGEPEMLLSMDATKAFIRWSQAKGLVGKPAAAQELLDALEGGDPIA